jgi:uncharacterized membrane protein
MQADSHSRSLMKAVSYRVFGSTVTGGIVYFFSHDASVSMGVGALDMVSKIVLYFLHERAWHYIPFGRAKAPDYEI